MSVGMRVQRLSTLVFRCTWRSVHRAFEDDSGRDLLKLPTPGPRREKEGEVLASPSFRDARVPKDRAEGPVYQPQMVPFAAG